MAYYIRVLSTSTSPVPVQRLQAALDENGLSASLTLVEGRADWSQIVLSHREGPEIAVLERSLVEEGEVGTDELDEFRDEIKRVEPQNAATWLRAYLDRVRCIYAFQILRGADIEKGWEILDAVKTRLWESAPGILQADGEGFTNEAGYHILWQFDASVKGDWWMAILKNGDWKSFRMDLGNREHRKAFKEGHLPEGLEFESA